MAKKTRRPRPVRARKEDANQEARLTAAERFQLEYAYVLRDLRQILFLAIAMFALLIALNLLLR